MEFLRSLEIEEKNIHAILHPGHAHSEERLRIPFGIISDNSSQTSYFI